MGNEHDAISTDELLAHAGWVRGLALRLARDPSTADDLVQETWLAALLHPPREGRPLRPWLGTVLLNFARRRARGEGRRTRREAAAEERAPVEAPDELLETVELQRDLMTRVLALAEPYRTVVLQRYYRGHGTAEIAAALGVPAATVRSQLARGLARLRAQLESRFDGDGERTNAALLALAGTTFPGPAVATGPILSASWKGALTMTAAWKTWTLLTATTALLLGAGLYLRPWQGLAGPPARPELRPFAGAERLAAAVVPPGEPRPRETSASPERLELLPTMTVGEPAQPDTATAATGFLVRAVDRAGRSVPGARLTLHPRFGPVQPDTGPAGPDGRVAWHEAAQTVAELHGVEDEWRFLRELELTAPGRARRTLPVTLQLDRLVDLGDQELAPGGELSVAVHDAAGQPCAAVDLVLTGPALARAREGLERVGPPYGEARASYPAATDGNGRAHLEGLAEGEHRLWAHREGSRFAISEPFEVVANQVGRIELELVELLPSERIGGVVQDPAGAPLAGVTVQLQRASTHYETRREITAADGRFEFALEGLHAHSLRASDGYGRYVSRRLDGVQPGQVNVVLRMGEPRHVPLLLLDAQGRGVSGVRARVEIKDLMVTQVEETLPTDAAGETSLVWPSEPGLLTVEAPGFRRETRTLDPQRIPAALEFQLVSERGLQGLVLRAGAPVPDARVELLEAFWGGAHVEHRGFPLRLFPDTVAETRSDEHGAFTLYRPEAGRFHLLVSAEGSADAEYGPFAFDPALGLEGLVIELDGGGTLAGALRGLGDRAAAGHVISISRGDGRVRTQRTDASGAYRFDGLTAGPWQVERRPEELPYSTNYGSRREAVAIPFNTKVRVGEVTNHDLDLSDEASVPLRGSLRFDGQGAQGWTVELTRPFGSRGLAPPAPLELAADGAFQFEAPPGAYDLELSREFPGVGLARFTAEILLVADEVRFERDLATGGLAGVVPLDADGRPREALIRWEDAQGLELELRARAREDGTLQVGGLPVGTYRVHVVRDVTEGSRFELLGTTEVRAGVEARFD